MESPRSMALQVELPGNDQLPEELQGTVPREVPIAVKHGRLAQKQRNVVWGLFVAGLICIGLDGLPFVETIALYVLPLGYLLWIGIGLCALAALAYLNPQDFKKACRYIQQGEAKFGRVTGLVKTPTLVVHGQTTQYAIVANVQICHPTSGEMCERQLKSRSFATGIKNQVSTTFRIGDAVPVVWIPGDFDRTVQIYDFLEVMPERSLVYQSKPMPLWKSLGVVLLGAGFFVALIWNLFAQEKYAPIDFDYLSQGRWPLLVGAGMGLAAWAAAVVIRHRERRQLANRNAEAILAGGVVELTAPKGNIKQIAFGSLLLFGAALLGGITTLSICMTANAVFDKSPQKNVPVQLTEMVQITHKFLFREYKIKYRRLLKDKGVNVQKDSELLTTPQHMKEFTVDLGIARVRDGWLGWPWVETIDPIRIAAGPDAK